MQLVAMDPAHYLASDDVIESKAPAVVRLASELRSTYGDDVAFAQAAYEWVRDNIAHSVDAQDSRVTLSATEVLEEGVGLCFAKTHLLAAILRAEGIPTGFCYQRFADGSSHLVHGLIAVHLNGEWHRQDPRGNKPGIDAQFSLTTEQLAWRVDPNRGEIDYLQVHARPAGKVLDCLRDAEDALMLCQGGLPSAID